MSAASSTPPPKGSGAMDTVSVRYANNPKLATAENAVQQRYAKRVIKELEAQISEEAERCSQLMEHEDDVYALDYLRERYSGLKTLQNRLSNAWAEVAGLFDEGNGESR